MLPQEYHFRIPPDPVSRSPAPLTWTQALDERGLLWAARYAAVIGTGLAVGRAAVAEISRALRWIEAWL